MAEHRKGEPTSLNVFALRDLFKGAVEVPNAMPPSSTPHIRRCLAAGLVEVVDRKLLRLTDAGVAAIAAEATRRGDREEVWRKRGVGIEASGRRLVLAERGLVPLDELTEREIRVCLGRPVR